LEEAASPPEPLLPLPAAPGEALEAKKMLVSLCTTAAAEAPGLPGRSTAGSLLGLDGAGSLFLALAALRLLGRGAAGAAAGAGAEAEAEAEAKAEEAAV